MPESNIAETVAELALQSAGAQIVKSGDGREFLIVPDGMQKHDIPEEYGLKRSEPRYLAQAVTLQAVDSLVDYVERFKIADTVLFADITANSICAVLDYHARSQGEAAPAVKRAAHRAALTLPFSEEWKIWTAANNTLRPQIEFARFLEENGGDVTAPTGAELLEVCRDLQAARKVNFTQAVRTASLNESFEYTDDTEARSKGGVELPTKFRLALAVYFGEPTTEVYAFLRWKLDDGKLLLGIQLHRIEHVRQAVFKQIVLAVGERTGCPVVFGKPA